MTDSERHSKARAIFIAACIHSPNSFSPFSLFAGKVYDVTEFQDDHPGGDDVLIDQVRKPHSGNIPIRPHLTYKQNKNRRGKTRASNSKTSATLPKPSSS